MSLYKLQEKTRRKRPYICIKWGTYREKKREREKGRESEREREINKGREGERERGREIDREREKYNEIER